MVAVLAKVLESPQLPAAATKIVPWASFIASIIASNASLLLLVRHAGLPTWPHVKDMFTMSAPASAANRIACVALN